jgi:type IV pilus assembly protein PilX
MSRQPICINRQNQKGVALVVGLIVLLIMTLLGITSMSSSTTELKAANNMQNYNLAAEAAETALDIVLDPDFGGIIWDSTTPQTLAHVAYYDPALSSVTGGSLDVPVTATFTDCSKVLIGYSMTESGQDGESSIHGMVLDVSASASVVSTFGTNLSNSKRLRGIQTVVLGCTKPVIPD